ncbi:hypothetical protein GETHLI_11940 [Geothrix limicola]|uniref:DUF2164 domain-containing protein n=1 Tax=Geothrix limicola TaxID=2927978 RepID=A0ABQ5QDH3_9BACT|nr:DUF2164 domain-containing protein [Geothrix limicola]GLH72692.1 hypothetical protein GETHLI_11940 [Geothrix limicola]
MDIKLSHDTEKRLSVAIQRFVAEEYGESLGELGAGTFLSFCLKELGPAIYNQAISDAQACMQERVTDLENICFAEETSYWGPASRKGVQRKPDHRR